MSTNAYIQVEGTDIILYKHWDGYPSATLPWLLAFHHKFLEERGQDENYEAAQLVRSSVLMAEEFDLDTSTVTGWGLSTGKITGEDKYEYLLCQNGTIKTNGSVYKYGEEICYSDME